MNKQKPPIGLVSFDDACYTIMRHSKEKSLNYCINYARAGIGLTGQEAKVQALYILNNMSSWRGDTAKAVRTYLKGMAK